MAKKRIETLIFDLDGTLIDSKLDIAKAVNYTLAQLGLPQLPEEQIKGFIGGGTGPLLKKALGDKMVKSFSTRPCPYIKGVIWNTVPITPPFIRVSRKPSPILRIRTLPWPPTSWCP